jgi:hypothetical protein
MQRAVGWSSLALLALLVACGSEKVRVGPAAPGGSGGATSGGASATTGGAKTGGVQGLGGAASGGSPAGGSAGENLGGEAGSGGEAGTTDVTPPTPTVCPQKASWGAGARLALSTADDDVLGGVTPDELSLVFQSGERVWVADRSSVDDDFTQPLPVVESEGYFAQATLSPDGLTLVGVRIDGTGFGALTRAARGEPFEGTPDELPFDALYGAPAASFSHGPFADPVFSADGAHLLYSALELDANDSVTVYDARGAEGLWPWGSPVAGVLLYAEAGAFRRPTALSSDQRTLFYWDEVAREARATWRRRLDEAFSGSESVGTRQNAMPNRGCDRLYYTAPGSAGDDLFVSDRD